MMNTIPILAANAIARLAFSKFLESGAGELGKRFTEAAITEIDKLREKILSRLQGSSKTLDAALAKVEDGDSAALNTISKYLDVEMEDSPEFAEELQVIANSIESQQIHDNSSMTQINSGGINYQVKTGEDNTNFFGGTHSHS